jgi:HPr kinase/phosphorylase
VPAIAGLIEIRGLGIVEMPWQGAAVLRLVVDLDTRATRVPEEADATATLEGVKLPSIVVNPALSLGVVVWHMGRR